MTQVVTGDWLTDPGVVQSMSMLTDAGYQAWFVGGCVRDALIGRDVGDIDVATNATPDKVIALAESCGIKALPTGIDHGTVTLVAGRVVEVTTFRRDVETDGRWAVVAFSDNLEEDAKRRDLTINALYADASGRVHDPLGGFDDLRARHIRFIGRAEDRIREDHLRSLRYFRFYAWYGDPANGPDPDALAAISANLAGLDTVSNERIGVEVKKLLSAPDPAPAVASMQQCGALTRILSGADARALAPLVHLEQGLEVLPNAIRRLAALGGEDVARSLRLSRADATALRQIKAAAQELSPPGALGYRLGADLGLDALLLRAALLEQPLADDPRPELARGASARFPVRAADLAPLQGRELGERLKALEARWIASDFTLSRDVLLS